MRLRVLTMAIWLQQMELLMQLVQLGQLLMQLVQLVQLVVIVADTRSASLLSRRASSWGARSADTSHVGVPSAGAHKG